MKVLKQIILLVLCAVSVAQQTVIKAGTSGTTSITIQGSGSFTISSSQPIVTCGFPLYACTTTSPSFSLGTLTAPWSSFTPYNTTYNSPLNPSFDGYTVLTDNNLMGVGSSSITPTCLGAGNNTGSGGSGDADTSAHTTFVAFACNGAMHLFHMDVSGSYIKNVSNGGENPGIAIPSLSFGFSRVTDPGTPAGVVFYYLANAHIFQQGTTITDSSYSLTSNSFFPLDVETGCPGPPQTGNGKSSSLLPVSVNDTVIAASISWTGGQGTSHLIYAYKPGVGCSTLDLATGNWWTWCLSSCTTMPPSGTETVCTDSNAAGGQGIHDIAIPIAGNVINVSGACFDQLGPNNVTFWTMGTGDVIAVSDTGSTFDGNVHYSGHEGQGYKVVYNTFNPSPNVRVVDPATAANLSAFTKLQTFNVNAIGQSWHGGVPNPNPSFYDQGPWITETGNDVNYLTPLPYQNEIFGMFPIAFAPIPRFGPTFNTATANQNTHFGCGAAIPQISQDGNWAFFLTDDLLNWGNGTDGQPLCRPVAIHLQ